MRKQFNKKIKAAILAGILSLSINCSSLGATYEQIGTGAYSWDKNWELIIADENVSSGDDWYTSTTRLKYVASTGALYWYEEMDGNSFPNRENYILLGNAADIFGEGFSEKTA